HQDLCLALAVVGRRAVLGDGQRHIGVPIRILRDDLSLTLLVVPDGAAVARFQPAVAAVLSVEDGQLIPSSELRARIADAGLALNGADSLFYLSISSHGEQEFLHQVKAFYCKCTGNNWLLAE
ncbi:MAG: hypothetical protein ACWGQW_14855, partial [bacterium]